MYIYIYIYIHISYTHTHIANGTSPCQARLLSGCAAAAGPPPAPPARSEPATIKPVVAYDPHSLGPPSSL